MIFDDSFFLLSDDDDEENKDAEWSSVDDAEGTDSSNDDSIILDTAADNNSKATDSSTRGRWTGGSIGGFSDDIFSTPSEKNAPASDSDTVSGDYSDLDYVIESDLVMPTIKPTKAVDARPTILTIDDDFSTLDLMKIYFVRDYDYVSFSGPREAIFYLNEHVVDLIFLDCYIHTIKAARVVDIIHSYKELANVPIIYLCDDYEYGAIYSKLPSGVNAVIQRPVSRKSVQDVLDRFLSKKNQ